MKFFFLYTKFALHPSTCCPPPPSQHLATKGSSIPHVKNSFKQDCNYCYRHEDAIKTSVDYESPTKCLFSQFLTTFGGGGGKVTVARIRLFL